MLEYDLLLKTSSREALEVLEHGIFLLNVSFIFGTRNCMVSKLTKMTMSY